MTIETKAAAIRLILLDVDGVLTDGKILMHADGTESKQFDIKDGTAIVWALKLGIQVGLLSARSSIATAQRAAQLGIALVYQGVASKRETYDRILSEHIFEAGQVAYMGDDLLDLPVLLHVGLSAAPADADPLVKQHVHVVTAAPGGDGAVRELIQMILRAQGKWDDLVGGYLGDAKEPA